MREEFGVKNYKYRTLTGLEGLNFIKRISPDGLKILATRSSTECVFSRKKKGFFSMNKIPYWKMREKGSERRAKNGVRQKQVFTPAKNIIYGKCVEPLMEGDRLKNLCGHPCCLNPFHYEVE